MYCEIKAGVAYGNKFGPATVKVLAITKDSYDN